MEKVHLGKQLFEELSQKNEDRSKRTVKIIGETSDEISRSEFLEFKDPEVI